MKTTNRYTLIFAWLSATLLVTSGVGTFMLLNTVNPVLGLPLTFGLILVLLFLYIAGAIGLARLVDWPRGRIFRMGGHSGFLFALLLVAAGLLLLAFNSGLLPNQWQHVYFSWFMLLFVIGSIQVCKLLWFKGLILVGISTFFLLIHASCIFDTEILDPSFFSLYWPVLLVLVGIGVMVSILLKPTKDHHCKPKNWNRGDAPTNGTINQQLLFSLSEQVVVNPEFKGGSIEAIFGALELDLQQTALPEGETHLHIRCVFGEVEIKAPGSWNIEIRSETFAGRVNDSRTLDSKPHGTAKLVLTANCVFGGVSIE